MHDREGDTTIFLFGDFYLFELILLLIYSCSSNGLKPRRVWDFAINFC